MRCAHCETKTQPTLREFFSSIGAFRCTSCGECSFICIEAFGARLMLLTIPWIFAASASMAYLDYGELGNLGWLVCIPASLGPVILYLVFFRRIDKAETELTPSAVKTRRALWFGEALSVATAVPAFLLYTVGSENTLAKGIAAALLAISLLAIGMALRTLLSKEAAG